MIIVYHLVSIPDRARRRPLEPLFSFRVWFTDVSNDSFTAGLLTRYHYYCIKYIPIYVFGGVACYFCTILKKIDLDWGRRAAYRTESAYIHMPLPRGTFGLSREAGPVRGFRRLHSPEAALHSRNHASTNSHPTAMLRLCPTNLVTLITPTIQYHDEELTGLAVSYRFEP